ncbi:uncharacterized protein KQ657_005129 [Scheffersomyces spartinae]|uniref:Ubiquitin domain-containing protein DSK2 n=1 Tax=Scheffersomyces spartinae TaxID=45513 RepID=A0A9P7V9Z8_9ASCO|nr:uncharacterized protein KQ657_005129 [Scheffersomyces spartinae]KAG7193930.1 hypothetical protein KQ657_005129 [Scheffersomyces spartinae]
MSTDKISIHIKGSGSAKYDFEIDPTITVLELKELISEPASVTSDCQRLIYSGKVLKDTETIASYKVQSGHTIHLVKRNASAASASAPGTATASNTTGAATTNTSETNNNVPSNIAAGVGAFNPMADLTGARYAGFGAHLPQFDASMFNDADPDQITNMMSNPQFQQSLNAMLDNPQMLDYMINLNPQLRAMGPQVREYFQSPMARQLLTNPEAMRSMMSLQRALGGGAGGAGGASAFPAPGNTTASEDTTSSGAQANAGSAQANPFASLGSLFPPAGGFDFPSASPAAPADTRPPEERFETQLGQLNDMGFYDFDQNVAALRRTGGSVQGAIEYLLNNP